MKSLLLLALLLVSCSALTTNHHYQYTYLPADSTAVNLIYPVYIDTNFGEADKISIENALHQWNHVMNGYAQFVIVDQHFDMEVSKLQRVARDHGYLILKIDSHNSIIEEPKEVPRGKTLAFANQVGGDTIYVVRDRLQNIDITYIMLHELGHVLGANHQDTGLMRPAYNPEDYQCVDYRTAQQVANYRHWEVHHLNYCIVDGDMSTKAGNSSQPID